MHTIPVALAIIIIEVVLMRSQQFRPGEKVFILTNDEGIQPGEAGTIIKKWRDTLYLIRAKDGSFRFLDATEVSSIDPERHAISVGDTIRVSSNKHNHPYARVGDLFRIYKIVEDIDSYEVNVNGQTLFFNNMELAHYI